MAKNNLLFVIIAFMKNDNLDSQRHDNSVFDRLPVSSAVCRLGSEKYPVNYLNFDCSRTNFQEGFYGIEIFFLNILEIGY